MHSEDSPEGGQFHGRIVRRRELAEAIFVQTSSSPEAWVSKPAHVHSHPFFWVLLDGDCAETIEGRHRRIYRPYEATFHPRWEVHTHESGPRPPAGIGLVIPGLEETPATCRGQVVRGERVQGMLHRLLLEAWTDDSASSLALDSLVNEFLGALQNDPPPANGRPKWLRTAIERLHDEKHDTPSLENLAQEVGVHPIYFSSEFRRRFGCSPGEYIREIRLRHACRRLAESEVAIGEIAAEAGFFDSAHFCRRFRLSVGLAPSEYRARFQAIRRAFP